MRKITKFIPGIDYFFSKKPLKGLVITILFIALVSYSVLSTRYIAQSIVLAIALWLAYIIDVANGSR